MSIVRERNVIVEHWWDITDRKTEVIGENLVSFVIFVPRIPPTGLGSNSFPQFMKASWN
jgi:hypothetical protein